MSFGPRELAEVAVLVRAVAQAEIMPRFRDLGAGAVRTKTGPLDLVTDADEAAEARLTEGLTRLFPSCAVVGEEAAAADESVLDRLGTAGLAFTVDPVDGTANFAAGLPLFGTMVAAVAAGEVVGAVIYDPVGDEFRAGTPRAGGLDRAAGRQPRPAARVGAGAGGGDDGHGLLALHAPAAARAGMLQHAAVGGGVGHALRRAPVSHGGGRARARVGV